MSTAVTADRLLTGLEVILMVGTNNEITDKVINLLTTIEIIHLEDVKNALNYVLNDFEIRHKENSLVVANPDLKILAIQNFFIAKKVEGLADSSLNYYSLQLRRFFEVISKDLKEITTNDIRYYLAKRQIDCPKLSKVTLNNERRVLNTFFGWCQSEDYVVKNPMSAIGMIKQPKRIKAAFSEIEMEKLRDACRNLRDKAMIEVLYSTGVRCQELVNIKIDDIDGDQISVIGKGDKERVVYLNAKAQVALKRYLDSRNDGSPYLFVSFRKPTALTKGRVESAIRELGEIAGVKNTHPHRFRRTAATLALNRGMPIEQVQQMLGHESIGTTTLYARSSEQNVKASHRKYVV